MFHIFVARARWPEPLADHHRGWKTIEKSDGSMALKYKDLGNWSIGERTEDHRYCGAATKPYPTK